MFIRNICVILLLASVAGCLEPVEEAKNIRVIETIQPSVQNYFFAENEHGVKSGHVIITPENQTEHKYFILTTQYNSQEGTFLKSPTAKDPDSIISKEGLQPTTEFENEELPFTKYGEYHTGNTVRDGNTLTYNIYQDNNSNASLVAEFQGVDFYYLQVGGDKFKGSLPSGEHTYKGANFVTNGGRIAQNETRVLYPGTFEMTINFDTLKGNITTTAASNHKITNGDILVDSKYGTFSGSIDMLNENRPTVDESRESTGNITGSFHGNGGVGVSGNYYVQNKAYVPTLIGSIVGARTHE